MDKAPIRYDRRLVIHEAREVADRLERLASANGRSLAAEIRGAIREHLAEQRRERER
jgi:hypothetical protein